MGVRFFGVVLPKILPEKKKKTWNLQQMMMNPYKSYDSMTQQWNW